MRPIAVSERILRANCCRFRTASATMSKSPARLPPTWRWMVTAVMTNWRFFEPTRSAISSSASSIGRQVGALEQAVHRTPVAQVAEGVLGRTEERREDGEPLALGRRALGVALRVGDVGGDAAAEPGALVRGERKPRREEEQEADAEGQDER